MVHRCTRASDARHFAVYGWRIPIQLSSQLFTASVGKYPVLPRCRAADTNLSLVLGQRGTARTEFRELVPGCA